MIFQHPNDSADGGHPVIPLDIGFGKVQLEPCEISLNFRNGFRSPFAEVSLQNRQIVLYPTLPSEQHDQARPGDNACCMQRPTDNFGNDLVHLPQ